MTRDIIAEAHQWREQVLAKRSNNSEELRTALADESLSEETLVWAYNSWWESYSEGVRKAPKDPRSGGGVRSHDALAAGHAADEFALAEIAERSRV